MALGIPHYVRNDTYFALCHFERPNAREGERNP